MRIAALYVPDTANAYYRVMLPLRALEARGHQVLWPWRHPPEQLLTSKPRFDVLVVHQLVREEYLSLVRRLREQGVAVVWDIDDDLSATPKGEQDYKRYGGRRGIRRLFAQTVEMACSASLITAPSAHLAQRYRDAGVAHTAVLENYVAAEQLAPPRPRRRGVVIGIAAGREHGDDFKRLRIAQLLQRILQRHPEVRVMTLGQPLDLRDDRYEARSSVPIEQLIRTEAAFEIGLAALCDTPFNRARSNVKLKEYAAAGAMWLASPVGPYLGLGEEQGGLLVPDGDWFDVLDDLVQDHRRRMALMERARTWVRGQSIELAVSQWESALQRAIGHARNGAARNVSMA